MILSSKVIEDGIFCHFCASMISGLATTIASMPVDIAKTRLDFIAKKIKNLLIFTEFKICE